MPRLRHPTRSLVSHAEAVPKRSTRPITASPSGASPRTRTGRPGLEAIGTPSPTSERPNARLRTSPEVNSRTCPASVAGLPWKEARSNGR